MKKYLKFPKNLSKKKKIKFFKDLNLYKYLNNKNTKIISPDLNDLYRLYQFIILNKRTTVLEFGSGWSSLVMAHALKKNHQKYKKKIKSLRRNKPFEIYKDEKKKKY